MKGKQNEDELPWRERIVEKGTTPTESEESCPCSRDYQSFRFF